MSEPIIIEAEEIETENHQRSGDELEIVSPDKINKFTEAKQGIKQFSQKEEKELKISTVKTGWWCFEHKVTGDELNSRLSEISNHLIYLNDTNNKTIKEFGLVYDALEALDKEYIQGIVGTLNKVVDVSDGLKKAHERIEQLVNDHAKTIGILKDFKQRLDSYAHLKDIDKIWSDLTKRYIEIDELSASVSKLSVLNNATAQKAEYLKTTLKATQKEVADLNVHLNQQIIKLDSVVAFMRELEKSEHLQDVDDMWDSLSKAYSMLTNMKKELSSFNDAVLKQQSEINKLLSFMAEMSKLEHLKDIDTIFETAERHSAEITELKKQDGNIFANVQYNSRNIDELQVTVHKNKIDTENAIKDIVEKNESNVRTLTKKIKYAYFLAGGTLGVAVLELIAILLRLI